MIERIEVRGKLINECTIAGETRADDVFPGHPNGAPLSRNRWFILYATRGWRKIDDDRSIIYQLRRDTPDGPLLKEGLLRAAADDWDPNGDGSRLLREHGHPSVFGVPKGATVEGKPAPSANVFVAKWRVNSKGRFDPATGSITPPPEGYGQLMGVEWCQFRLNDREDDIELIQPVQRLRQRGFESGDCFCRHEDAAWMNQTFVQAVPFNPWKTEWVDCNHFSGARVAALKYRFDPARGLYEWVETSPFLWTGRHGVSEASIARTPEGWVIAARGPGMAAWVRTDDPFACMPPATFTTRPVIDQPMTLYQCPDGVPRLFTGDVKTSPYGWGRNPLYCFDIHPFTFQAGAARMIFDCVGSGALPSATIPRAEMAKLLPHMGGRRQYLLWRVRTKNIGIPYGSLPPLTPELKAAHGIYYALITYDRDSEGVWEF